MQTSQHDRTAALKEAQEKLQTGDFAAGLAIARQCLKANSADGDALYVAAVACRYLKRFDDAADYLAQLHAAIPEHGRAWQENGHLALARGDQGASLDLYRRATAFNPALQASWKAQADILARGGHQAEAAAARAQLDRLAALPRELLAVTNHLYEGRLGRAEEICRYYLQKHPRDVEGMRLLAEIGSRLGILDDADFLLESAVEFAPDNIQLRLDYIKILRQRQKFAEARDQAERLYAGEPGNPVFASHLAIETMQLGDYERAFELFDEVLQQLPQDAATLTSKGHALKTMGQQDQAVSAYRAAIAAKPDHGDAFYSLANLKTYRFTDDEMAAMHGQAERADLAFMDRVHLSFALGKAHEDRGDYAQSFGFYEQGNSLKRTQSRYDADAMSQELAAQKRICTPDLFAQRQNEGHSAADPIFIVGLPRAGSTLLEQILASHSQIDGTLELPNILSLAHQLRGRKASEPNYPQALIDLSAEQRDQMGRDFIEKTRIHRAGAPFFIDKMPNNFRHIGLIHLILPNAKIIDARRAPLDCCFSCFKQLFAEGQGFTYGLTEIGQYYSDYVDLMEHWDKALPGRVLRVQHEDVLQDLEGQVRRMLEYLGLPFEAACLDFHQTQRAVRTASSEQVRLPINRSGQGAWEPYSPFLGALRDALKTADGSA